MILPIGKLKVEMVIAVANNIHARGDTSFQDQPLIVQKIVAPYIVVTTKHCPDGFKLDTRKFEFKKFPKKFYELEGVASSRCPRCGWHRSFIKN